MRAGARVLDLGCRPGSWLQYAAGRIGEAGALVGLDRQPLDRALPMPRPPTHTRIVVADVLTVQAQDLLGSLAGFDVVLSDLAPDTTGIRSLDQARSEALFERALDLALALTVPGGHFVGKLFQGPDMKRLLAKARAGFEKVALEKPAGSRKQSIELYVVARGRRRS